MLGDAERPDGSRGQAPTTACDVAASRPRSLVIGLGGSGIQTISRLRRLAGPAGGEGQGDPPIRLIGIDQAGQSRQYPPLSAEGWLGEHEYLNVMRQGFDPTQYLRNELPKNTDLQSWWDPRYAPKSIDLNVGTGGSRMLGRLAVVRAAQDVKRFIEEAVADCAPTGNNVRGGDLTEPSSDELRVYIVASSCGGSGSACFLDVIEYVSALGRSLDIACSIHAFVYLPGAFRSAVLRGVGGAEVASRHERNAFAFLRELDHFMTPHRESPPDLPTSWWGASAEKNLASLAQVFMVDALPLSGGQERFSSLVDTYSAVAEALYQMTVARVGTASPGDAAAVTPISNGKDAYGKRFYCSSFGIASVVYPGESLRRHLQLRFTAWFLREGLLLDRLHPEDREHAASLVGAAADRVHMLVREWGAHLAGDRIAACEEFAMSAGAEIADAPTSAHARQILIELEGMFPAACLDLDSSFDQTAPDLVRDLEQLVCDTVLNADLGPRFASLVLRGIEQCIEAIRLDTMAAFVVDESRRSDCGADLEDLQRRLLKRENHPVGRWFRAPAKVVRSIGNRMGEWGLATVDLERQRRVLRGLDELDASLCELRAQIDRAVAMVADLSERLDRQWRSDELNGRDASARCTSTFIPGDVQLHVASSRFAQETFDRTCREVCREPGSEDAAIPRGMIGDAVRRWMKSSGAHGPFGLGPPSDGAARGSEHALLDVVDQLATSWTQFDREGRPRLPSDLESAAATAGERAILSGALSELVNRSSQRSVQIDESLLNVLNVLNVLDDEDGTGLHAIDATWLSRHWPSLGGYDSVFTGVGNVVVDSPDPDRIVSMTLTAGIPAHSMKPVHDWENAYREAVVAFGRDANGLVPPVHLDRRWTDESLDPLIPDYSTPGGST